MSTIINRFICLALYICGVNYVCVSLYMWGVVYEWWPTILLNSNQTSALVKLMMKKHQPGIDESSTMTTNSLTIQLVYSLQTRIYISTLNELYESLPKQTSKFDFYLQILNTLQSLSMFLMNLNTKLALINAFTLSKNIDILINLLKLINSEQNFDNMNENSIKKLLIGSIVDIIFAIQWWNLWLFLVILRYFT